MNRLTWHHRALGIVVSIVVLTGVVFAAPELGNVFKDTRKVCEIVDEWVLQHKSALPASYESISAFPIAYRRGILRELANDARAAVWRQHFDRIAPQLNLDSRQRDALRAVYESLPELVGDSAKAALLRSMVDDAFHPAQDAKFALFYQLGPQHSRWTTDTAWLLLKQELVEFSALHAEPSCNCHGVNVACCGIPGMGYGLPCAEGLSGCRFSATGCGFLWLLSCDGMCELSGVCNS